MSSASGPRRPACASRLTQAADTADASDHLAAAVAIAKGLRDGHTPEQPGFWIHTSGTSILTWYDTQHVRAGAAPLPEQRYHDMDDIERLVTLPDVACHRDVDKLVVAANSDTVRAAIVCPPTVYGTGAGAVKTRSRQVPGLARVTLAHGFAPVVGEGQAEWDHVHSDDLGDLYVRLVDAARDATRRDDARVFGPHAYFFAENGSHAWADVARWVADEACRQGFVREARTRRVPEHELAAMDGASLTWGRNSKGVAERARRCLGWRPRGPPLRDAIAEAVAVEARALGLTPRPRKGSAGGVGEPE